MIKVERLFFSLRHFVCLREILYKVKSFKTAGLKSKESGKTSRMLNVPNYGFKLSEASVLFLLHKIISTPILFLATFYSYSLPFSFFLIIITKWTVFVVLFYSI